MMMNVPVDFKFDPAYQPKGVDDAILYMRNAVGQKCVTDSDVATIYDAVHVQARASLDAVTDQMKQNEGSGKFKATSTFNWGALVSAILSVVTPLLSGISPIFAALLPALGVLLNTLFPTAS